MPGTVSVTVMPAGFGFTRRGVVLLAAGALLAGLLAGLFCAVAFPVASQGLPVAAIALSVLLTLAAWALFLGLLPVRSAEKQPGSLAAWLAAVAVLALALAGSLLSGAWHGVVEMALAMLLVFAGGTVLAATLHSVLCQILFPHVALARQLLFVVLALALSALFWTRQLILSSGGERSAVLAEATLRFSPPLAVAAAWQQAPDWIGSRQNTTAPRFDLLRAPLAYEIWLGSYQAVPYPRVLPQAVLQRDGSRSLHAGSALMALLCAVPLLGAGEMLARWRQSRMLA